MVSWTRKLLRTEYQIIAIVVISLLVMTLHSKVNTEKFQGLRDDIV